MYCMKNFFTKGMPLRQIFSLKITMSGYFGTGFRARSRNNTVNRSQIKSWNTQNLAIKVKISCNRLDDKFYGLETINKNGQIIGKKPTLANKMLCYVIHGMTIKYTIPFTFSHTFLQISLISHTSALILTTSQIVFPLPKSILTIHNSFFPHHTIDTRNQYAKHSLLCRNHTDPNH